MVKFFVCGPTQAEGLQGLTYRVGDDDFKTGTRLNLTSDSRNGVAMSYRDAFSGTTRRDKFPPRGNVQ